MSSPDSSRSTEVSPRIWLLLSDKLGDNTQVEVLAEALGWPVERKRLAFRDRYAKGKPWFRPSLHHLERSRSDPLEPPWPDLILTVGRRPTMAALWVRRRSGNRTKIVLIGRPRGDGSDFALVVASAQYLIPEQPNVIQLGLPLLRSDDAALEAAERQWAPRLAALPRPLTALFVGGPTGQLRLDPPVALALLRRIGETLRSEGGSLYVSTSRRTPPAVAEAVAEAVVGELGENQQMHRWAPEDPDNPYLGLLAHADRFVVTGDSVSMQVEVARLGRPLAIAPLPDRLGGQYLLTRLSRRLLLPAGGDRGLLGRVGRLLLRLGLLGYPRDVAALHRQLFADGLAVPFGEPFPPGGRRPEQEEVQRVVARVRALFPDRPAGETAGDTNDRRKETTAR